MPASAPREAQEISELRREAAWRSGPRLPTKWAGAGKLLAFRATAGLRPALGNAVPAHLGIERRTPEAEQHRGRLLVPLGGLERLEYRRALDLLQRARRHLRGRDGDRRARLAGRAMQGLGEILEHELRSARDEHGALEGVLELAHVPRPGVSEQAPVRPGLDPLHRAVVLRAVALEEGFHEHRDVLAPLAQRRHLDGHGVDAEEEVLAEAALLERSLRAPVRGGDQAEVHGRGLRAAQPAHDALLEDAQELGLEVHRHLDDLVEQERAAVGLFQEAGLVGGGAGEGALRVAEELRLDEIPGQRRAVDLDPRPLAARAALVQRVRDQLLAGAALADDQHVGVGLGDRRHRLHHAPHPGRLPEDLAVGDLLDEPAAEVGVLGGEPAMLEGVLDEAEQLVGIERLLEDVERAGALRRLHRLAHRAVGRDDDDLERRVAPLELAREPDAVAVRQHEVEDRDVGLRLRDARERLPHARRGADRVALGLQRQAEAVGDRFLVVHHQHGPVPLHGRDTGSLIRTSVPWPTRLCTVSVPPWRSTTERAIDMPSPVPSVFVVKNGSNARARTSSVMPAPVSSIVTASVPVSGARAVVTVRRPPAASASKALRIRLRNALRSPRASSGASRIAGSYLRTTSTAAPSKRAAARARHSSSRSCTCVGARWSSGGRPKAVISATTDARWSTVLAIFPASSAPSASFARP